MTTKLQQLLCAVMKMRFAISNKISKIMMSIINHFFLGFLSIDLCRIVASPTGQHLIIWDITLNCWLLVTVAMDLCQKD